MGRRKGVQDLPRRKGVQDLPDECLALVLSRLKSKDDRDAAALTCRRWRSLEALSRHSLRFLNSRTFPSDQWPRFHLLLLQALHSFPNILSISIEGIFADVHPSFPRVFLHKGFAQLDFLDLCLSRHYMTDLLLQSLALGCPSLTHLSLCWSSISDTGMRSLANGCPLLQFLDMSYCRITDKGIDKLLSKCVDMRQFLVEECNIEGWGFRHGKRLEKLNVIDCHMSEAGLAEGLQGPTSLRTLDLSHIQGQLRLSSIGECCKGLEELKLKWSDSLDNASLQQIAESCKNLRALDVSWCHYVTRDGWEALALSGNKLEELHVAGCDEFDADCLLAIQEGCPNLKLLKLSDYFALHPSLAHFMKSRPAVELKFYDDDDIECEPPFYKSDSESM